MPLKRKSISILGVNHVIETAKKFGIPIEDFLKQINIDETMIPVLETRVDFEILVKIFKFCEKQYGPAFPLHLARENPIGKFTLIDYAMANCENLGEAYKTLVKYWNLASEVSEQKLQIINGEVSLGTKHPKAVMDYIPNIVESTLFHFLNIGRTLTKTEWKPNRVLLQNSATDKLEYSKLFKAPVFNDQDETVLIFDPLILELPIVGADSALKKVLDSTAKKIQARLPKFENFSDKVAKTIKQNLESQNYQIEYIADELKISVRTMQRKLKQESTTYNEILTKVRLSSAEALLQQEIFTIEEISLLLGYNDPSAFYKLFKKQLGKTPEEFRQQQTN